MALPLVEPLLTLGKLRPVRFQRLLAAVQHGLERGQLFAAPAELAIRFFPCGLPLLLLPGQCAAVGFQLALPLIEPFLTLGKLGPVRFQSLLAGIQLGLERGELFAAPGELAIRFFLCGLPLPLPLGQRRCGRLPTGVAVGRALAEAGRVGADPLQAFFGGRPTRLGVRPVARCAG